MLQAVELTKHYAGIPAVAGVSFTVRPGEILGYLGPNGSGKTTTVNMLTGLLVPTSGQIFFDGRPIGSDPGEYKRRLGYVPEIPYLYPYLSGREYLQLMGRLRRMPPSAADRRIDDLLKLFGLESSRHSLISSYSKGMRQKILISAALLHNPDVIIFDEPLSGLDVTTALVFRHLIWGLARKGKVIVYSSHVLEVVEKVCSRVVILHRGQVVANDSVESLRSLMKLPSLEQIFSQLVLVDNPEQTATDIVAAVGA